MNVSEKIKSIREMRNFTQEYMANELGMTQAGYSKLESGKTDVTFSQLTEVAKVLEISVEDLIAFDNQKFFNSFNNVKGSNNGIVTVKTESDEIKKLYEDKIRLLEQLLQAKEDALNRYVNRFGEV